MFNRNKKNTTPVDPKTLDQSFKAYVIRQFKKNKLAVVSLWILFFLVLVAVFADVIANEKPIVCKYKGQTMFPILKGYAVNLGLSKWDKELSNVKWSELEYDMVVFPPIPYLPTNIDFDNAQYKSPFGDQTVKTKKWWHWFGTDELGRDVLSGIIHGTRIALIIALFSTIISTIIGIFLGSLAGYFGDDNFHTTRIEFWLFIIMFILGCFYGFVTRGFALSESMSGDSMLAFIKEFFISIFILVAFVLASIPISKVLAKIPFLGKQVNVPFDMIINRIIEIFVCVPRLFLIIAIVAAVKSPSIWWLIFIIGITSWTGITRFIRAELLRVRNLEFIEAAKSLGYTEKRILTKHAIPNSLSPVLIDIAFLVASTVLIEASLSFLGIGTSSDTITWGKILALARKQNSAWWLAVFPGFMIFLTVTIFNLIGEGLTDALDPKLKK